MARCKWCGEKFSRKELRSNGYCEECYQTLHLEIVGLKAKRDELTARASRDLPDDQKSQIIYENETIYNQLRSLKQQKVSFFRSDIEAPRREIYHRLGKSAPPAPKDGFVPWIAGLAVVVSVAMFVGLMFPSQPDTPPTVSAPVEDVPVVPVEPVQEQPKTRSYSRELCSGHYTVGIDIPSGTYDFTATKGGGNVFGAGLNEIMGVSTLNDDFDFYTQKIEDVYLYDGEILSISGVRIGISSRDASAAPLGERDQEITGTVDLEPNFSYVSGTDFEPGTYCIEALSGTGNVWTEGDAELGMNEIMGVNDEGIGALPDFYEPQFNNVYLPDRTVLYVGDVSLRLTPSK